MADTAVRECHLVELVCDPGLASYSVILGYLHAAAAADPEIRAHYTIQKHIHYLAQEEDAISSALLEAMDEPDIVGFSIYFWNRHLSLEMARRVKARFPRCFVVVGGNDVTHQAEAVFAEAPWVDAVVHGEGEFVFREVLRALLHEPPALEGVAGLSFRDGAGRIADGPPEVRIEDLSEVPSPILSGVYEPSVFARARYIIFETSRGCPFQCAFCFWGGATGTRLRQFPLERVRAELDLIIRYANPFSILFLADSNFGMLPRDYEVAKCLVEMVEKYKKRLYLATNWAKNTNDNVVRTAKLLVGHGLLSSVTLSAQSFDPEVLRLANRKNIPGDYYRQLQATFRAAGIPTYTELIWGMPGETLGTFKSGIERVIEAGGMPVLYPLLLLNNTAYAEPAFRAQHAIRTRQMPYLLNSSSMLAEFVVSHATMPESDWLAGLGLSLALSLFYKVFFWGVLWYLHAASGARLVDMVEVLARYLEDEACALPRVRELYRNYLDTYRDPARFDREGVLAEVGETTTFDYLHYQAIVKHVLVSPERVGALLQGAADYLYASLAPDRAPARAEFEQVVAFQVDFLLGLGAIRNGRVLGPTVVRVPARALTVLVDAGVVSVAGQCPTGGTVGLGLQVPAEIAAVPFHTVLMGMYHGSVRPCTYVGRVLPIVEGDAAALAEAIALPGGGDCSPDPL